MDIIVFRKVFNNSILNKLIFNYVHHIFIDILKKEKTFKWNEVVQSVRTLIGNTYLNELKEYFSINNHITEELFFKDQQSVLIKAIKLKSLDIIKFIIKELNYDYNANIHQILDKGRDLLYFASSYGNIEITKYIDSLKKKDNVNRRRMCWNYHESFKAAPLSNDIKVVQFIYDNIIENNQIPDDKGINTAIVNSLSIGRLDMVEWLITISKNEINFNEITNFNSNLVSHAVENGYFDIIKWFHFNKFKFSSDDMDIAASSGHFEIVKWLHYNRTEGCTQYAMELAAQNDHFEILKWLHQNRTEGCTERAMDMAATLGSFEIINWLQQNRTEGCSNKAMDYAAQKGHFEIIKWLHKNRTEGCTNKAMNFAAQNGHFEIVKWLHQNRTAGCTTYAMNLAASNGHFEIVKWLHDNRTEGCTKNAIDLAAQNGHLEIVKWLHQNRTEGCTTIAMDYAAKNGYLEIVNWLHHNRTEGCTTEAMDLAAQNRHLEIIKWLHDNRTEFRNGI